jgi:uncharacterized protein YllA (UPF0747 family)
LKSLFEAAYLKHDNLADATRQLEFTFGTYGLVILDADDADLKRLYSFCKKELLQTSHKAVLETTEKIKKYNIQVNPREINLFYRR